MPEVTHRMTRYVHRRTAFTLLAENHEPERGVDDVWEVSCACGDVFSKDSELLASAAYLAHLPQPKVDAP